MKAVPVPVRAAAMMLVPGAVRSGFNRPGTDSMRMWPPATIVAISASRKSDCPTSVWANLARMRSVSCRARRRSSCVSAAEGAGTGVRMGAAGMAPVVGIAFASWDGIEGFEVNKAMLPTLP